MTSRQLRARVRLAKWRLRMWPLRRLARILDLPSCEGCGIPITGQPLLDIECVELCLSCFETCGIDDIEAALAGA